MLFRSAYRRQRGSIARGGRREIAHAPLQTDDQNPAGDAEYIQCDLPDQPATTDRKMRRPRQPETAQRLEHDRRRSEQPICHHDLTCDESDFARAATPARDEKIERRANTRAEQQRRREYMQTFDDDDAQLSRSRNTARRWRPRRTSAPCPAAITSTVSTSPRRSNRDNDERAIGGLFGVQNEAFMERRIGCDDNCAGIDARAGTSPHTHSLHRRRPRSPRRARESVHRGAVLQPQDHVRRPAVPCELNLRSESQSPPGADRVGRAHTIRQRAPRASPRRVPARARSRPLPTR